MKRSLAALAAVSAVVLTGPIALAGTDQSPYGATTSTDASGDTLGPDATSDILSASVVTTGVVTHTTTTTYTTETSTAYKAVKVKVKKKVKVKVHGKKKTVTKTVTVTKQVPYTTTVQVPHTVDSRTFTPDTLRLSMTLGDSPSNASPGQTYTFALDTPQCGTGTQDTEFVTWFAGDKTASAQAGNCSGSAGSAADVTVPVTVSGKTLIMDVPLAGVAKFGITPGAVLKAMSADTSTTDPVGVSPVSEVDLYDNSDKTFTYTVG